MVGSSPVTRDTRKKEEGGAGLMMLALGKQCHCCSFFLPLFPFRPIPTFFRHTRRYQVPCISHLLKKDLRKVIIISAAAAAIVEKEKPSEIISHVVRPQDEAPVFSSSFSFSFFLRP